jgi:hypothetical protein
MLLTSNAKVSYILFYEGVRQRLRAGFFKRGGDVTVLGQRHLLYSAILLISLPTTSALAALATYPPTAPERFFFFFSLA